MEEIKKTKIKGNKKGEEQKRRSKNPNEECHLSRLKKGNLRKRAGVFVGCR